MLERDGFRHHLPDGRFAPAKSILRSITCKKLTKLQRISEITFIKDNKNPIPHYLCAGNGFLSFLFRHDVGSNQLPLNIINEYDCHGTCRLGTHHKHLCYVGGL